MKKSAKLVGYLAMALIVAYLLLTYFTYLKVKAVIIHEGGYAESVDCRNWYQRDAS